MFVWVHPTTQAGIAGPDSGVYSICMSGGYSDDEFNDDLITYTGWGGIDQNTKRHIADQEIKGWNLGLIRNHESGQAIRVLAKRSVLTTDAKDIDYIYLGLYTIESWGWSIRDGFKILVYQLQAVPGISLGAEEAAREIEQGSQTPPERKKTTINRIIRDIKVSAALKKLYSNQCQTCDTKIITAAGPYFEGAHIRPLGTPHNGPDTLKNMLCLCPRCHTMFDGKALWIDHSGMIHIMGTPTQQLSVKPTHQLDYNQLAYHRSLCGLPTT